MIARPKVTAEMRLEAARILVADMIKSGVIPDTEPEECAEEIASATQYEQDDGYKIARNLESGFHWECNMDIAEAMSEFGGILQNIYNAAEKQWAADNPREPAFKPGDSVFWRKKPAVVEGVCKYRPQSYRLKQGDMPANSYYVAPFEEVTAA